MSVTPAYAVPHLTTALSGPLQAIERRFLERQADIEHWFRSQWLTTPAPFYASVDLRNAGFKLAPVDTNLFPAGFNNLNVAFRPLATQAIQTAAERLVETACNILLIPEDHSRNQFYLANLATLKGMLEMAGFQVRLGSLDPELKAPVELAAGAEVLIKEPLIRRGNRLGVEGFDACLVLLNNDLSSGRPEILDGLEQPLVPPPALGWSNRLKSDHFAHYHRVAQEFGALVELDSWLLDPLFRKCGEIDFQKRSGEDCLVQNVGAVLKEIAQRYQEHNIDQQPYVIVKADAGTYGMNIMTVHDAEQVRELNRKQRNKMAKGKGGAAVRQIMIQEGVYTFETWGDSGAVAEPVVYMIDHFVVGGFYRVHTGRTAHDNLNAPGMHFEPLAFDDCCASPNRAAGPGAHENRFYAYGVVARLALLAAARELRMVNST
ncbi:MAG: glutamate--cysteine ligase [Gammaproteobacteria bacterium]|nr:glutamate--cysteine ligase [Gammaproteobacteria bacterium]